MGTRGDLSLARRQCWEDNRDGVELDGIGRGLKVHGQYISRIYRH